MQRNPLRLRPRTHHAPDREAAGGEVQPEDIEHAVEIEHSLVIKIVPLALETDGRVQRQLL